MTSSSSPVYPVKSPKDYPSGDDHLLWPVMTDWGMLFAGMVIASVPLLVLYLAMSRQFISGLTAGALKG